MSASFTMSADWRFPTGTTLGVYKGGDPMTGPPGPAITTAVVAANGTATFTGLLFDTDYVLGALVSGKWFDSNFRTVPDPAVATASVAEVAAVSAHVDSVESNSRWMVNGYLAFADPVQEAINACSAAGGGKVIVNEGTWTRSAAATVPNFVEVEGRGQSSVIRCTGNHYAFAFNPGNRSAVRNLTIDASSTQSSGGGFDFTSAAFNISIESIYFGSNLHTSLNMKPAAQAGIWKLRNLRWNGVTGCNTAFAIGDGTNIVSDVYMEHLVGTAASITDMVNWFTVLKSVDTVTISDSLFYSGGKGMTFGASGSGDVTNCKFTSLVFDNCDLQGFDIQSCRGMTFTNCNVQGCGTSALPGVDVGASAKNVNWNGGDIHEQRGDGVVLRNGCADITFTAAMIRNNNTSNQTFGSGVSVSAGASGWTLQGCSCENRSGTITANQKYGLLVGGGASTNYVVKGNRFEGNVSGPYLFGTMTGVRGVLTGNVPEVIQSVAAAATVTLPPGDVVQITGNTNITSFAATRAGDRVSVVFTGTPTLTDGSNLKIAGNLVATADDTWSGFCDATNWFETGRAVN